MKFFTAIAFLLCLSFSVSAQFHGNPSATTRTATNVRLPALPVQTNPEPLVHRTHKAVFNLAARDTVLEADITARLEPTLRALRLSSRLVVLVISDDRIPYARLTRDGVFVLTSVLARREFGTNRDFTTGLLLRELARLALIAEFGNAVARADAAQLQLVDLKITDLACQFATNADIALKHIQFALTLIGSKTPGTPSTYPTDRLLYPGVFVTGGAPIPVPRIFKLKFEAPALLRPVLNNNRTADDLHLRGSDRASTREHAAVIAQHQSQ